jgi:hypothetical protein
MTSSFPLSFYRCGWCFWLVRLLKYIADGPCTTHGGGDSEHIVSAKLLDSEVAKG